MATFPFGCIISLMKRTRTKYLLTGGGTGGHVAPALAVAGELKRREPDAEFLYVGVKGRAESTMVPRAGFPLVFVRSRGYPGTGNPVRLLAFALALLLGCLKATWVLLRFRPHIIIATGGYVSAPVVFAAAALRRCMFLKTRVFLHEQNVHLGRLNKLGARVSDRVGVSFLDTLQHLPRNSGVLVGYPVRDTAMGIDRDRAREELGLPTNARVVFAFGGSQGARTINRAMVDALESLMQAPDVYVIHATGRKLAAGSYDGGADVAKRLAKRPPDSDPGQRYRREDFIHNMGTYYAAADLVVCRAGAGTLTEICAAGLASVIIPKANLPGDHQVGNARLLERAGAAQVLYEGVDIGAEEPVETVDGTELAGMILQLLDDQARRREMAARARTLFDPQVLIRIGDWVDYLAGKRPEPPAKVVPPAHLSGGEERVIGLGSNGLDHLLRKVKAGDAPALTDDERRLVEYKIDGYLASTNHVERARGCRMVGLSKFAERLPVLCRFATARDAAGRPVQPPFVRRDSFVGLQGLGVVDEAVTAALEVGLADPYFEVRTEAAGCIAAVANAMEPNRRQKLIPTLLRLLQGWSFEPTVGALKALGSVVEDASDVMPALRQVYFDPIWKVREALFLCLTRLVERGILTAEAARSEMAKVLITSNGYNAYYPLKGAYNRLRQAVANGNQVGSSDGKTRDVGRT